MPRLVLPRYRHYSSRLTCISLEASCCRLNSNKLLNVFSIGHSHTWSGSLEAALSAAPFLSCVPQQSSIVWLLGQLTTVVQDGSHRRTYESYRSPGQSPGERTSQICFRRARWAGVCPTSFQLLPCDGNQYCLTACLCMEPLSTH